MSNELTDKITDFRYVDLREKWQREYLGKMFDDWIKSSELEMVTSGMHVTWELDNLYYENHMVPLGFSDEHLQSFVYSNSGRLDTRQFEVGRLDDAHWKKFGQGNRNLRGKIFVIKNMITDVIDRKDARFAEAKRQINVESDETQRNDKIETFIQRYMDKVERKHQLWLQVHYPAIQQKHRLGLWWTQPLWNSRLNYAKGEMEWRSHHPQDVLIDPFPTLKYFIDARYIILKRRVPLDEAREYLAEFGIPPEKVQPDNDYFEYNTPQKFESKTGTSGLHGELNEFVTLYFPEFKKTYVDRFGMKGEEGKIEYEHTYYFEAVYHKQHGVLKFKINKYADMTLRDAWQFSCIPWFEKLSNLRLYPIALIEPLRKVQDIVNIGWTMKLDTAVKQNMVRAFVKAKLTNKFKNLVDDFLNVYGGVFPVESDVDISKSVLPFNISGNDRGLTEFTQGMEESFKDQKGSNQLTGGEMPDTTRKYLSGETIKQTRMEDYVRSQPDQLSVEWAASQEARRVYSILAMEKKISYHYGEEDEETIDVDDKSNPDKTHYIPVNVTWTLADYHKFLQDEYPELITVDVDPLTGGQVPNYIRAEKEFSKENYVKLKFIDPVKAKYLGIFLDKKAIEEKASAVNLNHLFDQNGDKWKCNIKIGFDFGFKQDEETAKELIGDLVRMVAEKYGIIALPLLKRWLKMFPQIENQVDDIIKEIEGVDKRKQMMDAIEQRGPEFMAQLQDLMQRFDAFQLQQQATAGTGKKSAPVNKVGEAVAA